MVLHLEIIYRFLTKTCRRRVSDDENDVRRLNSYIENRLVGGGIDGRNCENLERESGTTD